MGEVSLCTLILRVQSSEFLPLEPFSPEAGPSRTRSSHGEGTPCKYSRSFAWKPRPESGRDCLICAILVRQRPTLNRGLGGVLQGIRSQEPYGLP